MRKLKKNALAALIVANLAGVPAAALAQAAAGPSAAQDPQDAQVTELGAVHVAGRREADRRALEDKKNADNQTDEVRSDDVGRLPDQNVAEAARRLPGVTTVNDQGEGRYLTVRGVSPELLNVTLNGQSAAAPEPDGRQVKLDDIPSALIGAVKVAKTITPDMDANAIAGAVDIQTLSAFDKGRNFGSASFAYGYNDINGTHPFEYDASFGGLFGPNRQFGLVMAINHSDRRLGPQNVQNAGDWIEVDGEVVPEGIDQRQYNTHRQRSGAVANLDWFASDSAKMFLRLSYSKYEDSETRDRFGVEFDEDGIAPDSSSGGTFEDGEAFRALRVREENTSTTSASIGGDFAFGDDKLSLEATFSRADKRDPHRDEWTFTRDDVTGSYALGSERFTVTPDASAFDPAGFELDAWEPESRHSVERLSQFRADYTMPISPGEASELQFGVKFMRRKKTNDENGEAWEYDDGPLTMADVAGRTVRSLYGGEYPMGPGVDNGKALDYFNGHMGEFERDDEDTLSATLAGDYRIREDIGAAYLMGRLHFGALTVVPGVRVERTKGQYAGHSFELGISSPDQAFNNVVDRAYTDWFPGVNFRYDVNQDLVVRAAATRAIGRPNYESLAPFVEIEDAGSAEPEVAMGNPYLKPLYSTNLDFAVERYFGNRGMVSAAAFYKKIKNPIYETTVGGQDGTFGGVALTNAEVGTWANAESATLRGVEFAFSHELSFLPAPFDGLSFGANLSLTDSGARGLPGRTDEVPLLHQSDRVASAQLSYEKGRFSGRLAWTYRSASLNEVHEDDPAGDVWVDDFRQWDLKLGFAATEKVRLFIEGANINDEPFRTYVGRRRLLGEQEIYGWTVRAGVQIDF